MIHKSTKRIKKKLQNGGLKLGNWRTMSIQENHTTFRQLWQNSADEATGSCWPSAGTKPWSSVSSCSCNQSWSARLRCRPCRQTGTPSRGTTETAWPLSCPVCARARPGWACTSRRGGRRRTGTWPGAPPGPWRRARCRQGRRRACRGTAGACRPSCPAQLVHLFLPVRTRARLLSTSWNRKPQNCVLDTGVEPLIQRWQIMLVCSLLDKLVALFSWAVPFWPIKHLDYGYELNMKKMYNELMTVDIKFNSHIQSTSRWTPFPFSSWAVHSWVE